MVRGYVLVSVEPGKEMQSLRAFKKLNGVKEAVPLLGDIDFLLIVEKKEPNDIARLVVNDIRSIRGIRSTKTLVEDEFVKHFDELA